MKKSCPSSEKPTSPPRCSVLGVENRGHGKYIAPQLPALFTFSQEAACAILLSENTKEMKK
ncbi:mCG1028297, isoform CRA_a [Mus musculus]|nr:mCG1028297, isoform CRA_a [Mus musculus]